MRVAPLDHHAWRLDNGLQVVAVPRRGAPLVHVGVRYRVGWADDPPAHRGLAHLVEHLLFTGSRHMTGDVSDQLYQARALGANGATTARATDYYQTVPRENLERILWLESDRMGFMRGEVTRKEVALAREVVATELRIGEHDARARLFGRVHNAVFAPPHPYFDPVDATTLAGVDVAVVEDFLRRWVVPANAALVIAGDLPDGLAALVRRYFGDLSGGTAPTRAAVPPAALTEEVRQTEPARHVFTFSGWASPALPSPGDAAADVAAALLEWNPGGRMWPEGEVLAGLAARQVSREGVSLFVIEATGRAGSTAEQVQAAVDAAAERLLAATEEDVAAARSIVQVGTLESRQSLPELVAQVHAHLEAYGKADAMAEAVARYDAIGAAEVAGFARAVVTTRRRAVVLARPGGGR